MARDRLLPTLRGRRAAFHHRLPSNHRHNMGGSRRPTRRPAISKTMLDEGQTLKLGDRGPAVAHAQALLRKHGFRVGRTGYLGARTQLKILAFQKANDLKQTGALNPETYAALSKPPGRALTNPRGTALANAVKEAINLTTLRSIMSWRLSMEPLVSSSMGMRPTWFHASLISIQTSER